MTPADFKSAREALGLTQPELARLFRVASDRTVRKWECGERDIPGPATVLIELLLDSAAARSRLGINSHGHD